MPRTVIEEKTVFKFAELSESAKDAARNWYRDASQSDEWWDYVYEDAARIGALLGIDIRQKRVSLMSGATRFDPEIYFDLDRANYCVFSGVYRWQKGSIRSVMAECPQDTELHAIARVLFAEQRKASYTLTANMTPRGRGDVMDVDASADCGQFSEDGVSEAMRDFAAWIKSNLQREWDWINSDECIDDNITANDYEFSEDGERQVC